MTTLGDLMISETARNNAINHIKDFDLDIPKIRSLINKMNKHDLEYFELFFLLETKHINEIKDLITTRKSELND